MFNFGQHVSDLTRVFDFVQHACSRMSDLDVRVLFWPARVFNLTRMLDPTRVFGFLSSFFRGFSSESVFSAQKIY